MSKNNVYESVVSLLKRPRRRLTWDARKGFMLPFALFNAMFCLLFVLLLQNRQLTEEKRQMENSLETIEPAATEEARWIATLEGEIDTLGDKIEELLNPTHTPTIASSTAAPTLIPPTSTPLATVTPTLVASPTATSVPPSPTNTPIPPTPTSEPTPTPTPKPPKPKPTATLAPPPPTPTRPLPPTPTRPSLPTPTVLSTHPSPTNPSTLPTPTTHVQ